LKKPGNGPKQTGEHKVHPYLRPETICRGESWIRPYSSFFRLLLFPARLPFDSVGVNLVFTRVLLAILLLTSCLSLWSQPGVNIIINTNTPDAGIFLDAKPAGITDHEGNKIIKGVPPGIYEIKISKAGYLENRQVVTVSELSNTFNFTMEKTTVNQLNNNRGVTGSGSSLDLAILLIIMAIIVLAVVVFMMVRVMRHSSRRQLIGKFELREVLGKGGIATTYKARDLVKKKIIALKVLDPTCIKDDDLVYKFFSEGKFISSINKEFPDAPIVKVFDFGRDREEPPGIPFIAMELVKGGDLLKIIKQDNNIPVARKLRIAREVARGLKAAHHLGIFHGDITPDNIIVNGDNVTLIDFGVALQHYDSYKNMDASVMGKPVYMSPEQCEGKPIDEKSDVYSLGIILFFMFFGRPPFESQNPIEIMNMHKKSPLPELDKPVPADIKKLIYRVLDKIPQKRPGTAELEKQLEQLIHKYEPK